jgi:hypothetical protein
LRCYPDIVEAILEGRHPPQVTLAVLMRPFCGGMAAAAG